MQTPAEMVAALMGDAAYIVIGRDPVDGWSACRSHERLALVVDTDGGEINLAVRTYYGGDGVPMREWHGIVRRYTLASGEHGAVVVDRAALEVELTNILLPLAQRLMDGASVEWDGSNHVARLTDDARMADGDLQDACEAANIVSDRLQVWAAADWLQDYNLSDWPDGVASDDVDGAAAVIVAQAKADGALVSEAAIANCLRDLLDEAQT